MKPAAKRPGDGFLRHVGWLAALLFLAAAGAFGSALPGYSQAWHPLALLGARGVPHASAFNLLGFVLPGLLAALAAWRLRANLPVPVAWPLRIGAQALLLAGLAFVAMGLLPLDPADLENPASRLHGSVWMLWCVAFASSGALLGLGWLRRRRGAALAAFAAVAALLLAGFALPGPLPPGVAERLAFAAWLLWLAQLGRSG